MPAEQRHERRSPGILPLLIATKHALTLHRFSPFSFVCGIIPLDSSPSVLETECLFFLVWFTYVPVGQHKGFPFLEKLRRSSARRGKSMFSTVSPCVGHLTRWRDIFFHHLDYNLVKSWSQKCTPLLVYTLLWYITGEQHLCNQQITNWLYKHRLLQHMQEWNKTWQWRV